MTDFPDVIDSEEVLDEVMTRPSRALESFVRTLPSPLLVVGAGGKMGPSLCVQARRAADASGHDLEVIAVSRFSSEDARQWLEERGVRTLAADVMDRAAVERLPDATNVIYLVGQKFGTSEFPERTWAANTLAPAYVAERYPAARIVALSTGNVYPLGPVERGGADETEELTPLGEYANAAVARERIFQYYASRTGVAVTLVRLNYAVDLRYGVLVDIARKIVESGLVDVTMGYFNCIWQGDANDMILRSLKLAASPPAAINLTGEEVHAVRDVATRLAQSMGLPVRFTGQEAETALLSNASKAVQALGRPATPLDVVLRWTAHWVTSGKPLLGKPTHFEVRDGRY